MQRLLSWLSRVIEEVLAEVVYIFRYVAAGISPNFRRLAFLVVVLMAFVVGSLFDIILEFGRPLTKVTISGRIIGAISMTAILVAGWALFWLRENRRFTYGCLELGAAMAAAFHAVGQMSATQNRLPALLAYLGALYIAVRGYDNLQKASDEFLRQQDEEVEKMKKT